MSETLSIDAIPHRPPFRFVDRIVDITQRRIVTEVKADPDADFFRGHYPNHPIMPGVLICESCFQAGALLIAHVQGSDDLDQGIPVLTRIQDARFKRIVKPGQTLRIDVELDEELDGAYYMTGRVTASEKIVLRVTFVCMQAPTTDNPT